MPNLSKEVIQFAAGNTDFYTAFQDFYAHDTYARTGKKIDIFNEDVSLSDKKTKIDNAFFAEVERMSGVKRDATNENSWAANPVVSWAGFAVREAVINSLLPLTVNPSIGLYTDIQYASYGDIVHFKVQPRTLFTVSLGAHGERTTHRQKDYAGDVIIAPKEHIITTYTDMYTVLAGRESPSDYMRRVVLSIETAMTADATAALTTGMQYGTYPAALSVQGAFNPKTLIKVAETVQAYNFGMKPMIVGTASALSNVVGDSTLGFRGNYDASNGSVGLLRDFYGYTLFQIPQVATGNYTDMSLALPDDTLFVISPATDKLVKMVISNTLNNSNQFYDNADITSNNTVRKDWDAVFASAGFGGMYKITD